MTIASISEGAAVEVFLAGVILGFIIALVAYERHADRQEEEQREVAQEWGGIDAAATRAYYGVAEDIARDPARRKTTEQAQEIVRRQAEAATEAGARRPWIVLTCNGVHPEKPYLVDPPGFEALTGASMDTVLVALGYGTRPEGDDLAREFNERMLSL